MAASSCSNTSTVTGTMLWVNLNKLKHKDWEAIVIANNRSSDPFQTYLLHNQARTKDKEAEHWWAYQSNVYGVVIAANSLDEESILSYPRVVIGPTDTIIEHFIPRVTIVASDFREIPSTTAEKKLDVLDFLADDKMVFYAALRIAMECFRKVLLDRRAARKEHC